MPTLTNEDFYPLTYSKLEKKLQDVDKRLKDKNDKSVKNPTLRETLIASKARLAKALKTMADYVANQKREHDKWKTAHDKWETAHDKWEKKGRVGAEPAEPKDKSGYITTWKTTMTYGQTRNPVQKVFGAAGDLATKGMDILEDKKGLIATVGVSAAVMGVAKTYLPKLMAVELEEGVKFTVAGQEVIANTVGEVIKNFFLANPALTAGLGIAGIAAVAIAIPAIRSKIRNSSAYQGKMLAREETAKLKADILDLNEGQEHDKIIGFYSTNGMEIDDKGNVKVDESLVKIAAQDEKILEALEKDLTYNGSKMPAESRGKLAALVNAARAERAKIVSAATKADNQAKYESKVNVAMNKQVVAALACTDETKKDNLEIAQQEFVTAQKDVKAKQATYDTALKAWKDAGSLASGTEFDAKKAAEDALNDAKTTLNGKVAAFKGAFEAITDAAGEGKFDKYKSPKNLQNQFTDAELCNLINMKLEENSLTRT